MSQIKDDIDPAMPRSSHDQETRQAVRELLELLPADVVEELNRGDVDVGDSAFLSGLTDHVSRQAMADPRLGQQMLGKLMRLKKLIARRVREADPQAAVSTTVVRDRAAVGRNTPCPCGSGRKFKQCCLRKA